MKPNANHWSYFEMKKVITFLSTYTPDKERSTKIAWYKIKKWMTTGRWKGYSPLDHPFALDYAVSQMLNKFKVTKPPKEIKDLLTTKQIKQAGFPPVWLFLGNRP